MGYASFSQTGAGIHLRQYSRSFIVDDGSKRVLIIVMEICDPDEGIHTSVLNKLQSLYGDLYTVDNVAISSTHTHSGPGGYFQYFSLNLPQLGFVQQTLDSIVDGVVKSVQQAHDSIQPGYITMNKGNLTGVSINRSPTAYLLNPPEERAMYDADVDHEMVLLKLTNQAGDPIGMINWFPVHGTSMNKTNQLISSDNKGVASQMFEKYMNPDSLPGRGPFVAAFAQANLGDVSPNTQGALCQNTGLPCDADTSTCNGDNAYCYALGPGQNMFESTKIIGDKQFQKAKELFESATTSVSGPINFIHQHVDMSNVQVVLNETTTVTTCPAALGFSFAGGTTDGPGLFPFRQGSVDNSTISLWNLVRSLIKDAPQTQIECQTPKPILFDLGHLNIPYPWAASIVSSQLLQIGNFLIAPVPGELTTMAGRRLRNVLNTAFENVSAPPQVVVASLSNVYTHYITTFEEYQAQRYEGASTIFGPYTLNAHLQINKELANALIAGTTLPAGPTPPDLLNCPVEVVAIDLSTLSGLTSTLTSAITNLVGSVASGSIPPADQLICPVGLQPAVAFDSPGLFKSFGQVVTDAQATYQKNSTVSVTFISANPRNDPRLGDTFLTVEMKNGSNWVVVATDADWETKFKWVQTNLLTGQSQATVEWYINQDVQPGSYRIRHFGNAKVVLIIIPFGIKSFTGTSRVFTVA